MVAAGQTLTAVAFVCSLKPTPSPSSSDLLAHELLRELEQYGVHGEVIRAVDYNIAPGVTEDMDEGDDWPELRRKMLVADIFIMATPTWRGHMSSVAQRIIERLNVELSFADKKGRLKTYGKAAGVVVVGNEDGAHKVAADLFQGLNDVGFTIPAAASTYWNGEAMQKVDYKDLKETPAAVKRATRMTASNLAHAAKLLKQSGYPGVIV